MYLNDPHHSVEIYEHFIDLIEKMLEYDPAKRLTPFDALRHPFFQESPDAHQFQLRDDLINFGDI